MGPKKLAPVAGQMSMTSFFMKKPGSAAESTPAVKKSSMDLESGAPKRILESGSTDRDGSTPYACEKVAVTATPEPTPIVESGAEAGKKPETEDEIANDTAGSSKPVKRRLEEFANDDGDDEDDDNVVIVKKSKTAPKKDTKGAKKQGGSPKKKAKTASGSKDKSRGKGKPNKKKMVIESDDEEKQWDEDAEEAGDISSEEESGDDYSEESNLEDSEDESLEDSDDDDDDDDASESEEESVKRKPAKRAPTKPNAAPAKTPTSKGTSLDSFSAQRATTPSMAGASPSGEGSVTKAKPLFIKEGVFNDGKHMHDEWDWLHEKRRDMNGRKPSDPDYNPRTLYVSPEELKKQTPAMHQWWLFKRENMDTVLFFKVGKFYELFHMDADVGMRELDLIYMKGEKAHSGFPEISYGKMASALCNKGYRVARVEQTETPDMLAARNKASKGAKAKVVARELCSVMSKGTRTYCHIDDCATTLEEHSSSVLMCIKESTTSVDTEAGAVTMPEYGVCCVDTILGTVTLAQFSDNNQCTRLRTMVSQFSPNELLLEHNQHSEETKGVMRLLAPAAKMEILRESEMPDAQAALTMMTEGAYFAVPGAGKEAAADQSNWPVVLQAVAEGVSSGSALVAAALGGATWLLKRSQIDYEVLSMKRVFGYVPPDDEHNAVSELVTTQAAAATVGASEARDVSAGDAMDVEGSSSSSSSGAASLLMGGAGTAEARTSMTMDAVTLANLEILVNNFDRSEKGSLWHFINRCKTAFGRRLLKTWLCQPLFKAADIARRAAAVEDLLSGCTEQAEKARGAMKGIPDLERLLARVHSNALQKKKNLEHPSNRAILYELPKYTKNKIQDFAAILSGFEKVVKAVEAFKDAPCTSALLRKVTRSAGVDAAGAFPMEGVKKLLAHFRGVFDERQALRDGVIKPNPGMNDEYDAAKSDIAGIHKELEEYLVEMKRSTGISDIKFFSTNKDRFQLEVPKAMENKVPRDWKGKSQKKTHRRYWTATIERLLAKMVEAEARQDEAQGDTLRCIFEKFDEGREAWRSALACVALLDALLSLAAVSAAPNYCWPEIRERDASPENAAQEDVPVDAPFMEIEQGRHPMLEFSLLSSSGGEYIPNSVSLGGRDGENLAHYQPKLMLLSGPNMGGKSTLLRQTCLLAIMAQMGMKVPAESLKMSPVDRIFTRVGASDRILAGQSTFFVELAETAIILKSATQDSLCILDELGRGTATFDGTAIAHAVVDRLVRRARCRTLFATHYHSLVDEWSVDARVKLGHMQCIVTGGEGSPSEAGAKDGGDAEEVAFLYHLGEGCSPKSYGINVARLARLPIEVIQLATRQSQEFEERLKRSSSSSSAEDGSSSITVAARDLLYFFYDRLVSLVGSDMSIAEKASVARDVWTNYKASHAVA